MDDLMGDSGLISGSRRCPGEGNGNLPVFLPGKFHGQQCLEGYSPRGRKSVGHDLGIKQHLKPIFVLVRTYSVPSPILGLPRKSVVELWAIVFAHNSIPRVPGMKLAHFPKVCRMPMAYKLRPGSSMFLFWNEGCVFQDSLRVEMRRCWQPPSLLSKAWESAVSLVPLTPFPSSSIFPLWFRLLTDLRPHL